MPNSALESRSYRPSDKVLRKIESAISKLDIKDGSAKGLQRAKHVIQTKSISYHDMKRIKNYFDTYEGDKTDDEYKLNGGKTMQKWVEKELGNDRDTIHGEKQARMNAGEENQFIQTHEKDQDNADPTGVGMVKIAKGSKMRNIMNNDAIYEEVSSIKKLIAYLNNKI